MHTAPYYSACCRCQPLCLRTSCLNGACLLWVGYPRHSLDMTGLPTLSSVSGGFVVCLDSAPNVCLFDNVGHLKAMYGGRPTPIHSAVHVAVTDAGFLLILDADHQRIVMLDMELNHVVDVVAADHSLIEPRRLCWDDVNSRLFVSEAAGNVVVFELQP